jgi:hypothetical protein
LQQLDLDGLVKQGGGPQELQGSFPQALDLMHDRLEGRWRNLILVHLPLHASWLNQIEIYFSIVQRKVLEPNDFPDLATLARTLNAFERHWSEIAEPFDWQFTRDDLAALMERLSVHEAQLRLVA